MKANGEAVYGTNANPLPARKGSVPVTTKGNRLYVFTETGQDTVTLPGLASQVVRAWVLASAKEVNVQQNESGLTLHLPADEDALMPVIVVECADDSFVSQ